jgi:hypothetical protein
MREGVSETSKKIGFSTGAGCVKVGRRVGVRGATNADSNVGLIVGVAGGVDVGGGSTMGKNPEETS